MSYVPQDSMSLWWLADPLAPQRIGTLSLQDQRRKVAMSYDLAWMASPNAFALSEDLPLQTGLKMPAERDTAVGAVDDARPDQWGERVIRLIERPTRRSLLEYLYWAGEDRFGALGVSLNAESYVPAPTAAMSTFEGLIELHHAVQRVMRGEVINEQQRRLLQPGVSMGGTRPKSLMKMDGASWVVKFAETGEMDTPLIEYACMQMALRCGINTAETQLLTLPKGHALAVKRFDRIGQRRLHVLSARVALHAAGEGMGYPELSQILRRLGHPDRVRAQQQELFRRMVFNILIDNTDDHEKNHALIRGDDGFYDLSPAFDVVSSVQGLGYQQMRVGAKGHEASMANALSEVAAFGLSKVDAGLIALQIATHVDSWETEFLALNATPADMAVLSQYLDGSVLRSERLKSMALS